MNSQREAEWAEARKRCRLTDQALAMARELGLNPRNLIKNIPNRSEPWKAPVEDWVRNMYEKRFGNRKLAERKLPQARQVSGPAKPPPVAGTSPGTSMDQIGAEPETPAPSLSEIAALLPPRSPNELEQAREELFQRFERGEINEDDFFYQDQHLERSTPVSEGEIEHEDYCMLKRYRSFRLAAEKLAAAFAQLPFVQKVVLFGSVAAPLRKEVPRFSRLRRARARIWHECQDVDLAVWLTDLSNLAQLRKALSSGLRAHQLLANQENLSGVANHQVHVVILEPNSSRVRGFLCDYSTCPKGKPECEVAGCGAQPFLRLYDDFKFEPHKLLSNPNVVLFDRYPEPKPDAGPLAEQEPEIPF